jgi:hypothetical protein
MRTPRLPLPEDLGGSLTRNPVGFLFRLAESLEDHMTVEDYAKLRAELLNAREIISDNRTHECEMFRIIIEAFYVRDDARRAAVDLPAGANLVVLSANQLGERLMRWGENLLLLVEQLIGPPIDRLIDRLDAWPPINRVRQHTQAVWGRIERNKGALFLAGFISVLVPALTCLVMST